MFLIRAKGQKSEAPPHGGASLFDKPLQGFALAPPKGLVPWGPRKVSHLKKGPP